MGTALNQHGRRCSWWWTLVALVLATIAMALSLIDLAFAFYADGFVGALHDPNLVLPSLLLVPGILCWAVALPRFRPFGKTFATPKSVSWVALIVGTGATVLGGAELYAALADAGPLALLDYPLLLFVSLGALSASLAAKALFIRQNGASQT